MAGSINYKHLFKSFLDTVSSPVFIVDRTLAIRYNNQLAARLWTPLAKGDRLDQAIADAAVILHVQEVISTGVARQEGYERVGDGISWRVSVTPLAKRPKRPKRGQNASSSSKDEFFAVVIEDMAELHRLERVQHDFLANVSHELSTPLTSVRLLAETLEDVIDTDPDKAQQFVEKIEKEVQYLTGMVAELLELSRIESGQLPMMIEPIEVAQLVREVMARMLPLAQRHRVRLLTSIQHGKVLVTADSKLITRVLVNLVHNAIKFTPSGGSIVIGTAAQKGKSMQRFFVRDTGAGIREEDLPRVFERFFKTDRARAKADFIGPGGGGTGLGLAIARQVVEAHGGRIMAESVVGEGSTFTFTLPVAVRGEG
ncbi:MAG TPA: HAMP domain-containing sensor histidine kinase [Ktedonobacteraceae bacterium]|nr:HAMP domain-containing sensor histidine kinase [Ktedonobacteraceae bacterium]HEV2659025.1 HAMP domain-containing sensor histidine kinase [Ktedonobacteraceae bacterium]